MGKLNQEMADMKEIREADERWLRILFGEPYEAKFQSEGTGSAVLYEHNVAKSDLYLSVSFFISSAVTP